MRIPIYFLALCLARGSMADDPVANCGSTVASNPRDSYTLQASAENCTVKVKVSWQDSISVFCNEFNLAKGSTFSIRIDGKNAGSFSGDELAERSLAGFPHFDDRCYEVEFIYLAGGRGNQQSRGFSCSLLGVHVGPSSEVDDNSNPGFPDPTVITLTTEAPVEKMPIGSD